jgi:putative spermidine/putrescine transport system ATP-binding protein
MAFLELHDLVKRFGDSAVVRGLSLNVERGEFVSLLGGSGCGKTTTLRMIAGFETPSSGRILLEGADISAVPPNRRKLGMVFQSYALFPNMSVRRNVAFGLKTAGKRGAEVERKVDEMLELIRMRDCAGRFPNQLSGGQQQRVALARALAREPAALLLDEPLSALDAKIRVRLREDIRDIQRSLGITMIYVTHDQEEALSISDRIAVMREGRIEQIGAPFEIYNRPATPYVASFIGTLNTLPATVLDPATGELLVEGQRVGTGRSLDAGTGEELRLCLRPEALSPGGPGANRLEGRVEELRLHGPIVRLVVLVGESEVLVDRLGGTAVALPAIGDPISLAFDPESCVVELEASGPARG